MTYEAFEARAHQVFNGIPAEYREGVEGIEVTRRTVLHPTLPEVFTLGECISDFYPSEFGGAGEVRSRVMLYYGSFLELARTRDDWDWEEEIWETVTHEVRHHLEHLALEDDLEGQDYAADQNYRRRDGLDFDPFFFRYGGRIDEGVYEVDDDLFLERAVAERRVDGDSLEMAIGGRRLRFRPDPSRADVHFVRAVEPPPGVRGELYAVLVWNRGWWASLRRALTGGRLEVIETEAEFDVV